MAASSASLHFSCGAAKKFEVMEKAVHWRNLGDWGEFGCIERKATKICMLIELVSKILYTKFCFCDVISHMIRVCGSKKIFIVEIKLN